ncbi:MAG: hypothetical protein M1821_002311 [Bathelium mastoideum]|nr:MAG: hypothetical protein M1821_002311 [Bathelium mastoideum]
MTSQSKYAALFANPKGPGDARPTALQIIRDENLLGTLTDKVMLVTGCTSGLGIETARAFLATGATVWISGRDKQKLEAVAADLSKSAESRGRVLTLEMDQSSLASVRAAADEFLLANSRLNVLVNNGGIMAPPYQLNSDGHESQWQVNYLSHFLLTRLLLPTLLASSTPELPGRVVNISSNSHHNGPPDFSDLDFKHGREYSPGKGYGQSKTANIWHANYLDRTYTSKGVHAISLTPGGIFTGLQKYVPRELMDKWTADQEIMNGAMNPAQGAATQVLAALGQEFRHKGGLYLENCKESVPAEKAGGDGGTLHGYKPWAFDPDGEDRLWKVSCQLVGVKDEPSTRATAPHTGKK